MAQNRIDTISDDDLLEAASLSDTRVGLSSSLSAFPHHVFPNTPPIVLVSQLYSSVKNRTDVDRELDQLKQLGSVRIFKLLSGKNDYAIVTKEDYVMGIKKCLLQLQQEQKQEQEKKQEWNEKEKQLNYADIFDRFIEKVLPSYTDVQIHKTTLLALLFNHKETVSSLDKNKVDPEEEAAITVLVNAGLFLLHEISNFWFCIPHSGSFIAALIKGRKEIISVLKRQKFKELLLSDLSKKKLRYSSLSIDFLIRDMSGLSIVERIPTTNGYLIRLQELT